MATNHMTVELEHDCIATIIPGGQSIELHRGETVLVTQSLGDRVTVQTQTGYLVRLSAADSVAMGLVEAPDPAATAVDPSKSFDPDEIIAALKNVFDPEIPINIVDLGLVYRCEAVMLPDGSNRIEIDMSMTAPGCGMGDILKQDAATAVKAVAGVSDVEVELVWDPPWGLERISDAARLQLGML